MGSSHNSRKSFEFDAFLSYATDPDYAIARKVESFLESFHTKFRKIDRDRIGIEKLNICRDDSDFRRFPSTKAPRQGVESDPIRSEIQARIASCRWLIILCSTNSMNESATFVDFELQSFLSIRNRENIILVVTERCETPCIAPDAFFSARILREKLHTSPWLDLRELSPSMGKRSRKTRDAGDALVQLAASLLGRTAGEIRPVWQREQQRIRRRRVLATTGISLAVASSALVSGLFYRQNRLQENETQIIERYTGEEFENLGKRYVNFKAPHSRQIDTDSLGRIINILSKRNAVDCLAFEEVMSSDMSSLSQLTSLIELRLKGCGPLRSIEFLEALRKLRLLSLSATELTDEVVNSCDNLPSRLETVYVNDNADVTSQTLVRVLTECPSLKLLSCASCTSVTIDKYLLDALKDRRRHLEIDLYRIGWDASNPDHVQELRTLAMNRESLSIQGMEETSNDYFG